MPKEKIKLEDLADILNTHAEYLSANFHYDDKNKNIAITRIIMGSFGNTLKRFALGIPKNLDTFIIAFNKHFACALLLLDDPLSLCLKKEKNPLVLKNITKSAKEEVATFIVNYFDPNNLR